MKQIPYTWYDKNDAIIDKKKYNATTFFMFSCDFIAAISACVRGFSFIYMRTGDGVKCQ